MLGCASSLLTVVASLCGVAVRAPIKKQLALWRDRPCCCCISGQNPTNAEVKALPDNVDFPTALQYYEENKKEPESAEHIEKLFRVWDKDNSGVIPFDDLAQCLKIFGSATQDNFVEQEVSALHLLAACPCGILTGYGFCCVRSSILRRRLE